MTITRSQAYRPTYHHDHDHEANLYDFLYSNDFINKDTGVQATFFDMLNYCCLRVVMERSVPSKFVLTKLAHSLKQLLQLYTIPIKT